MHKARSAGLHGRSTRVGPERCANRAMSVARPRVNINVNIKINVKGNGQECPFHTCGAALRAADKHFGFALSKILTSCAEARKKWGTVKSRFLHSAVAFAPAPVGMTGLFV